MRLLMVYLINVVVDGWIYDTYGIADSNRKYLRVSNQMLVRVALDALKRPEMRFEIMRLFFCVKFVGPS